MERGNTRQEILDTALNLFSVQGYEASSVSQIAEAVGIRKASVYSHFGSKQEILNALVQEVLGEYSRHSIFTQVDWDDPAFMKNGQDLTPETILQTLLGQIRYILHDPQISKSRKMLTIEPVPESGAERAADQTELYGCNALFYGACPVSCSTGKTD